MKVYLHRTKDEYKVFYVGIASDDNRPISKTKRSKYWKNVENKHGRIVEIVADNLTKEEACELEIFLIHLYGRRDLGNGCLVNMTNGGDGRFGSSHTKKSKSKISNSLLGRKLSEKTMKKITRGNHYNAKKVINTKTKEIFDCAKDASEKYSISTSTINRWLNNESKNKTNLRYL